MHFPLKNGVSSLTRLSQLQIQVAALPFRAFTSTPESQGVNEETAAKRRTEELLQKQRQQNAAKRSAFFTRKRVAFLSGLALLAAGGVVCLAIYEKIEEDAKRRRVREMRSYSQGVIGGGWELLNEEGKLERSKILAGNYVLMYFGFVNCPDICPEEMEKIVAIVDDLANDPKPFPIVPVFISVDPKRDTPARVKEYCARFSSRFRGYTADSEEKIKSVTKKFRAYYSRAPAPDGAPAEDYLVDHSIIIYLLGPNGEFIEHFGRDKTAAQVVASIRLLTRRSKHWWNLWGRIWQGSDSGL